MNFERKKITKKIKHFGLSATNFIDCKVLSILKSQKSMLQNVLQKKEFCIIILDACRYDYFSKFYHRYFDGELKKVYSSGRDTFEFLKNTFPDFYKLTYISGTVPINSYLSSKDMKDKRLRFWYKGYIPKNHFEKIVDVWLYGWDDNLGSVHPKTVNKYVLQNLDNKMIVHYLQPHAPYIGRPKILGGKVALKKKVDFERTAPPDFLIQKLVEEGKISYQKLRKAYEGNLKLVLKYSKKLVRKLYHSTIVITADHGELLGEYDLVFHPRIYVRQLLEVPLLILK